MAKSIKKYNAAATYGNNKVGNIRYYTKGGETYTRAAHNSVSSNPRTAKQMNQRLYFSSMMAMYRKDIAASCYYKEMNQSYANAFMQANKNVQGVYLTKEQHDAGNVIVLPVCVTKGKSGNNTIFPISQELDSGYILSDIAVGSLSIGANTTVGELAQAIFANNPGGVNGWKQNDRLGFVRCYQVIVNGIYRASWQTPINITLNTDDTTLLSSVFSDLTIWEDCLAVSMGSAIGGACFTHSRTDANGALIFSTQFLVNCNAALIASMRSDAQFEAAWNSYGGGSKDWIREGSGSADASGYPLSVQSEDAAKGSVSGGGMYEEGDQPTFTATAAAGYEFEGWYRNGVKFSSANPGSLTMPGEAVIVVAKFQTIPGKTVTLTASPNTGGTVQIDSEAAGQTCIKEVPAGTSVTLKAVANTAGGWSFIKWSDDDTNAERTVTVNNDLNLTATFNIQ